MSAPRLFASVELAARIERAEATLIEGGANAASARLATAPFVRTVAGGCAACTEPGSPLCKVAGLGFDGAPSDDDWSAIERAYEARGVDVQLEIATLATAPVAAQATRRGYELVGFENVLGRAPAAAAEATRAMPIRVERIAADRDEPWLATLITGFAHPDTQGVASHEAFPRDVLERVLRDMLGAGGFRRYLAYWEGALAGAACLRTFDGITQLCGAATLPALRRRGVQSALLAARLADAAASGCDVAVMTTQPGSKSQQNAHALGFELLYARAILVRRARSTA